MQPRVFGMFGQIVAIGTSEIPRRFHVAGGGPSGGTRARLGKRASMCSDNPCAHQRVISLIERGELSLQPFKYGQEYLAMLIDQPSCRDQRTLDTIAKALAGFGFIGRHWTAMDG